MALKKKSDLFGKHKSGVTEMHYSTELTFKFENQLYCHAHELNLSYVV